ncbi:ferredoxin [Yoonia sp. 208BN28-4]|uniref:ferredoxin n=1 Tax=Yoonia sp. 208BN28-4 TaxID=3126505 RepID=UPI0030A4BC74
MTEALRTSLTPLGLQVLGICEITPDDGLSECGTLHLVGPSEPEFWQVFSASDEYNDSAPDPLDRWSRRVLGGIAADASGAAVFPFGGPPFHPIMTWALRTGRFWHSPIGFLVHDTAGLFASFRGAILLPDATDKPQPNSEKPCTTCAAPCASACPVDAFADGYDVLACKAHVASPQGRDCLTQGCRARRACPVGQGNRLPAQAAFHMEAFL